MIARLRRLPGIVAFIALFLLSQNAASMHAIGHEWAEAQTYAALGGDHVDPAGADDLLCALCQLAAHCHGALPSAPLPLATPEPPSTPVPTGVPLTLAATAQHRHARAPPALLRAPLV
ncbi:MAG: hypothetical protein QM639_20050 [Rhodocyclaceae bacterium]